MLMRPRLGRVRDEADDRSRCTIRCIRHEGSSAPCVPHPWQVGADLTMGSLIKSPGGTIATGGGYIAGRADLVAAAGARMTAPGVGLDAGARAGRDAAAHVPGVRTFCSCDAKAGLMAPNTSSDPCLARLCPPIAGRKVPDNLIFCDVSPSPCALSVLYDSARAPSPTHHRRLKPSTSTEIPTQATSKATISGTAPCRGFVSRYVSRYLLPQPAGGAFERA